MQSDERRRRREIRGTNAQGSLKSIRGIFLFVLLGSLHFFAMICTRDVSLSLSFVRLNFYYVRLYQIVQTGVLPLQGEIYRRFIPHFRFISLFFSRPDLDPRSPRARNTNRLIPPVIFSGSSSSD